MALCVVLVLCLLEEPECDAARDYGTDLDIEVIGEFSPFYAWEGDTVVEPAVLNGSILYYRAGWSVPLIGVATRDACGHWVRRPDPLFSGAQPWVMEQFGVTYLYYTDIYHHKTKVATSPDGVTWSHETLALPEPDGFEGWGNRAVQRGVLYQDAIVRTERAGFGVFMYTSLKTVATN